MHTVNINIALRVHHQHHRKINERKANQQRQGEEFRNVEKAPWNVAEPTLAAQVNIEWREEQQKGARKPNQESLFEAEGEVRIGFDPCHRLILQ